ncbi:MAG: ATP-dependent DNA helicase [archaeon]
MDEFLFPHEKIREVQDEFIKDVAKALEDKKNILLHAPTGLGKTTILAPALAYAIKNKKTIFFITPMHTQHKIAIETLKKIKEKHKTEFVAIDLIGKRWMCQQKGVQDLPSHEFGEYCLDMIDKGECQYHSNIKKKGKNSIEAEFILREIKNNNPLHVEEVCERCGKNKLCPYEICCILGQDAQVIIGDYHHVLNPSIRETLFKKMNKEMKDAILIFDEGHNLPGKIRDLLTATTSNISIEIAARECRSLGEDEFAEKIEAVGKILEKFIKEKTTIEMNETIIVKKEFYDQINKIDEYEKISGNLNFIAEKILEQKKRSFCHNLAEFMEKWVGPDEGYARIITKGFTKHGKPLITLSYRCLDPSIIMKPLSEEAKIIVMSGTLVPTTMYKDLFGMETEIKEYRDTFPKKNRLNLIIPKTTTKFSERNSEMYNKIAIVTSKLSNAVPGNVAIFFPSYRLIEEIHKQFVKYSDKTTLMEIPGMNKEMRQEFLERFKSYKSKGAVMLGCSSGSFGEGIDLPGEYLKGVIVVGLPLSKPDLETKKLIEYYDKKFGKGWDYGYIYPAILKTIQNAGRCIRSKHDRGVRIFVDERYTWPRYQNCFPKDWEMKVTQTPITAIEDFFRENL